MFNRSYVENAPEGGVAMLEVLGEDARTMQFVPLQSVQVSGEVTGPVAGMQVVHVFSYTKQVCSRVIEAVYRFPLPGDAAVTGVSVRFGDVEIQAVLEPRAQAEKDYEEAKRDRRQAALVTREAADVFTLRVAGIKPDQEVRVETAFVQLARAEGAGWSLRIPLTVAVRYTRGDESPAAGDARPLAQAANPGYRASLDLTVFEASSVASPTHALSLTRDGTELHARFEGGDVLPDCDAVITWQPAGDVQRTTLSAFTARREGHTPFLALIVPPSGERTVVPRELTVLVDHSGSMKGAKWEAADWAVKRLIGMLTKSDRLSLGVFHSTITWWTAEPCRMDEKAHVDSVQFLESHKDSGGTELGVALEQAIHRLRPPGDFSRQILIVTDAQVSDEGRLIRLAEKESLRPERRRISILCVDSSPNADLARQLAEAGGGSDWYVTSNPEGGDITTALDEIVDAWAQPIATGLRLDVRTDAVYASTRKLTGATADGWRSLDLGDLPAGRPLWVSGEAVARDEPLALRLLDGKREVLATWIEANDAEEHGGAAALVGARRLQQLEALKGGRYTREQLTKRFEELGITPAETGEDEGALYPENQPADETLAKVICHESLRSGIASTETAFVAVRSEAGKSVERTIIVANATPEGWEVAQPVMVARRALFVCQEKLRPPDLSNVFDERMECRVDDSCFREVNRMSAPIKQETFNSYYKEQLERILNTLSEHERQILIKRVGLQGGYEHTLEQVGTEFQVTRERIRQIEAKAKRKLKEMISRENGPLQPRASSITLFDGVPVVGVGSIVLAERTIGLKGAKGLRAAQLTSLIAEGDAGTFPEGAELLLFVGDMARARARVRLSDLLGGATRPLNITCADGQVLRLVLLVPGTGTQAPGHLKVTLGTW